MKPEFNPWEEKYERMRREVAKTEAEIIAAQMLGDGACLIEAQEGSGMTVGEFEAFYHRLKNWEDTNM
jgi:hypothetical protein